MSKSEHDWITVHRARFAEPVDATTQDYSVPARLSCARIGIDTDLGSDGMPISRSAIWGAWSICENRAAAEEIMRDPSSHFPLLKRATECWNAMLIPYSHHGSVNWRGTIEDGTAIRVANDPGGDSVAVITTAAIAADPQEALPRIVDFLANVWRARDHLVSCNGNVGAALFAPCDDLVGITFSLWRSDATMASAAYGSGVHQDLILRHRQAPMFDRSSFTRARIVESNGSWDGNFPFK